MNWNQLNSVSQLPGIAEESSGKTVLIFKHSTRCGISAMALQGFENDWDKAGGEAGIKAYYLDLLAHRDVSDRVAEMFGVTHKSPQVLLIEKGGCVFQSSHSSISYREIKKKATAEIR